MTQQTKGKSVVFLCECGPNLKEGLDLDAMEAELKQRDDVERVVRHGVLCSPEGKAFFTQQLQQQPAERVVVAACSPREHERTFKQACGDAGLNAYLMSMVNIREHVSWVTGSRELATDKAMALTRAALQRVAWQQPLEIREIDASCDVLVVGSGIAGLTAAKTLAAAGRQVTLVERDPVIGGRAAMLSDVFPQLECASCLVEPLLDEVLHDPKITCLTHAEVEQVVGAFGNFTAQIRRKARYVDAEACLGTRCCHEVCPVEVANPFESGMATRKAVYIPYAGALPNVSVVDAASCLHFKDGSCDACVAACPFGAIDLTQQDQLVSVEAGAIVMATGASLDVQAGDGSAFALPEVFTTMALERMLNSSGCTEGAVVRSDGQVPKEIALIHCASDCGAAPIEPCSSICCMSMIKYARLLRDKLPEAGVSLFTWDRCVGGKGYRELALDVERNLRRPRIALAREQQIRLEAGEGGGVRVVIQGPDGERRHDVDMAVVAPPLVGSPGTGELAELLRVDRDGLGFIQEDNDRLRPFATRIEGIFVAGSAQAPLDMAQASGQGAAAAGQVLSALVPGRKIAVQPERAHVTPETCGGCRVCPMVCPFKAITFDEEQRVAEVNDLLCRGCGACAAACPSAAIAARHFTSEQILAEIDALVSG